MRTFIISVHGINEQFDVDMGTGEYLYSSGNEALRQAILEQFDKECANRFDPPLSPMAKIEASLGDLWIEIDGRVYVVVDVDDLNKEGEGRILYETPGHREFILFKNKEMAGQHARDYWENVARTDANEFLELVGAETLISWAFGEDAYVGTAATSSINEWLDLHLEEPEEHLATYDGEEKSATMSPDLLEELGWGDSNEIVAYRRN